MRMYILFGTFVKPCIHMVLFYKPITGKLYAAQFHIPPLAVNGWIYFVNLNLLRVGSVGALRKAGMCSSFA